MTLADEFALRRPEAADAEGVTDVLVDDERAVRGESQWGVIDTRDWWQRIDLVRDAWVVSAGDRLVAFAGLVDRGDNFQGWVVVHPDFTGRGIAGALADLCEQRVIEAGRSALRLDSFPENEAAMALLEARGYRDVRHYQRMSIELDASPEPPEWPAGLTVSSFESSDARGAYEAMDEAFSDEWGHVSPPFEEWKRMRLSAPDFDPTLWFLAREGDEIAGFARCDPMRWGGGWIQGLGVRKPWRRRGLGLALLRHVFREFHRRGESRVGLGVDAENSPATRLYHRVGMRIAAEHVVFEKELR